MLALLDDLDSQDLTNLHNEQLLTQVAMTQFTVA